MRKSDFVAAHPVFVSQQKQKPPEGGFAPRAETRGQWWPGTATQYPTKVSVGSAPRRVKADSTIVNRPRLPSQATPNAWTSGTPAALPIG